MPVSGLAVIDVPYSLSLGVHDDAKDVVVGDGSTLAAGTMTVILYTGVPPARAQSIIGSLKAIYRHLSNENLRKRTVGTEVVGYANYASASSGNITIAPTGSAVVVGDVLVGVSGSFPAGTHFYKETFDQLINVLREKLTQN